MSPIALAKYIQGSRRKQHSVVWGISSAAKRDRDVSSYSTKIFRKVCLQNESSLSSLFSLSLRQCTSTFIQKGLSKGNKKGGEEGIFYLRIYLALLYCTHCTFTPKKIDF